MADFEECVSGCGGHANKWSQDKFIGKNTFGSNGVCGPLAAVWIKDRKIGVNFSTDVKSQEGRDEVMQLKLNQHHYKGEDDYVAKFLHLFGLSKHFQHNFINEVSISQLLEIATSGPGYYFIGLSDSGVGAVKISGHAFAIDMYTLKFFDPNFGQASFNNVADLSKCFTTWFRLMYLDLRGSAYLERYF